MDINTMNVTFLDWKLWMLISVPIFFIFMKSFFRRQFGFGGFVIILIGVTIPIIFFANIHSLIQSVVEPATVNQPQSHPQSQTEIVQVVNYSDTLDDINITEYSKANLTMDNLDSSELGLGDY